AAGARDWPLLAGQDRYAWRSAWEAAWGAGRASLCFEARRPSACESSFLCFLCAATPRFTRDIGSAPYLEVRQQLADELEIALGDERLARVTAFPGRALVLVEVALVRLRPPELAATGEFEALLGTAMALDLGHAERPPVL